MSWWLLFVLLGSVSLVSFLCLWLQRLRWKKKKGCEMVVSLRIHHTLPSHPAVFSQAHISGADWFDHLVCWTSSWQLSLSRLTRSRTLLVAVPVCQRNELIISVKKISICWHLLFVAYVADGSVQRDHVARHHVEAKLFDGGLDRLFILWTQD